MSNILKSLRRLWSRKPRSFVRRPAATVRLGVECLEGRITPANNITITAITDLNINISPVTNGVVTITTNNAAAQLSVTTLETQLSTIGVRKVIVSTAVIGIDGGEAGVITWPDTAGSLDIDGIGLGQSLVFQTDATATVGDIFFSNAAVTDFSPFTDSDPDNADSLLLTLDSSAVTTGTIGFNITGAGGVVLGGVANLASLTLDAGTGGVIGLPDGGINASVIFANAVSMNADTIVMGTNIGADGAIEIQAGTQVTAIGLISGELGITIEAPTIELDGTLQSGRDLELFGDVNLSGDLTLDLAGFGSQRLTVTGDITGVAFDMLVQGNYQPGALNVDVANFTQDITVDTFIALGLSTQVGGLVTVTTLDVLEGILGGTGTLFGIVTISPFATLAPGGFGASGTLAITGDLNLDGTLLVDVGDLLTVTGIATLGGESRYRPDLGGVSPIATVDIMQYGTLLGTFDGIADGDTVLFGSDAFTLDYGLGAADAISLIPGALPALPGKVFTGFNEDGTPFTVRLTGPGQLAIFVDGETASVITRATTAASVLMITSKPTAGTGGAVTFSNILVNGAIKSITAPTSIIVDTVGVTSTVTSITILGIDGDRFPGHVGHPGGRHGATSVKAAILSIASVVTAGTLKKLTLTGGAPIPLPADIFPVGSFYAGTISAAAVGTIKLTWDLVADLNVTGNVQSIQAAGLLSSAFGGSDVGGRVNLIKAGAIDRFHPGSSVPQQPVGGGPHPDQAGGQRRRFGIHAAGDRPRRRRLRPEDGQHQGQRGGFPLHRGGWQRQLLHGGPVPGERSLRRLHAGRPVQ